MQLLRILKKIKNKFADYNPSVKVCISRKNLLDNLREYQKKYPKLLFAPVLKSNAYGHGLVQIAEILDKEKIAFLVLDSLHEAMILRNNGIKSDILIIGYTQSDNIIKSRLAKVSFTITSLEQLQELAEKARAQIRFHLKIDTGMHRQGILLEQVDEAIKIIKANTLLALEGVCSHFADADNRDEHFSMSQVKLWNEVVQIFQKEFKTLKYLHITNTAGNAYNEQIYANVARLGIGLYGINTSISKELNLEPVLQMQSIVSSVKKIKAGEQIGYNGTYKLERDAIVATVPVGYFEGVDRRLSNCGCFKIGGIYCPIVGRVSMNITSIDVTSVPNVKLGDKVIIISDNAKDENSIENIATVTQAIPYEILIHISPGLRRIII